MLRTILLLGYTSVTIANIVIPLNEDGNINPVEKTFDVITGKWKPLIIYHLKESKKRFSELEKLIPKISKRMLTKHLREMEADKLVVRLVYAEVPPRVEYYLTDHSRSLIPILDMMVDWGIEYLKDVYGFDPDDFIYPKGH